VGRREAPASAEEEVLLAAWKAGRRFPTECTLEAMIEGSIVLGVVDKGVLKESARQL